MATFSPPRQEPTAGKFDRPISMGIKMSTTYRIAFGCVVLCLASAVGFAQPDPAAGNPNANRPGAQNITVQGVFIDAGGVLRSRSKVSRLRRPAPLADGAKQIAVSLPRLFSALRSNVESGTPIPDELRWLDGLVRIDHILVDQKRKELAIVGPAEPVDSTSRFRPVGRVTGRPVLQLDDLIVALRTFGPTGRSRSFGCTLVHSQAGLDRVAAMPRVNVVRAGQRSNQAANLKQALGPLEAKYFGVPVNTRFAFVSVEADYRMKEYTIGVKRLPVPRMRNYLARSTGLGGYTRFWFTENYGGIQMTEDQTQYALQGPGLKLLASNSPTAIVVTNGPAQEFADEFTKNIAELEERVPCFADLHNLTDLAVFAALIANDRLHERVSWDTAWITSPENYQPVSYQSPRQAETLVNSLKRGSKTVTVAGGVQLSVRGIVRKQRVLTVERVPEIPQFSKSAWSIAVKGESAD